MERKLFIRNTLLGLAACLLPEILRPLASQVEEEMVPVKVATRVFTIMDGSVYEARPETGTYWIQLTYKEAELLEKEMALNGYDYNQLHGKRSDINV